MGNVFTSDDKPKVEQKAEESPAAAAPTETPAAGTAAIENAPEAEEIKAGLSEVPRLRDSEDASSAPPAETEEIVTATGFQEVKDEVPTVAALKETMLEQEAKTKAEAANKDGKVPDTKKQVGKQKKDKKSKFGFKTTMGNRKN